MYKVSCMLDWAHHCVQIFIIAAVENSVQCVSELGKSACFLLCKIIKNVNQLMGPLLSGRLGIHQEGPNKERTGQQTFQRKGLFLRGLSFSIWCIS